MNIREKKKKKKKTSRLSNNKSGIISGSKMDLRNLERGKQGNSRNVENSNKL